MNTRKRRLSGIAVVTLAVALLASCAVASPPVVMAGDRDGLVLEARVLAAGDNLVVETLVRNERPRPVHLVPDQCGRVTEVVLARTVFEPEGERWEGSLQAAKDLVLQDQVSRQHADRFHPCRPGESSSAVAECQRPELPVRIGPGESVAERWELPLNDLVSAQVLSAVGSEGSVVRAEVVEARAADELEFLDIFAAGSPEAEDARRGRALRTETPASAIIDRDPDPSSNTLSLGQLFDRLVLDATLRSWIEAQPADSWRYAALAPAYPQFGQTEVQLRLVTVGYERAANVTAGPMGDDVVVRLPAEGDRARVFARRPASLPPGVRLIDESAAPALSEDLIVGDVILPSGRIAVGEYLFEDEVLDIAVAPASYPAYATLVRYEDESGASGEAVALATLVLSAEATVRWEQANVVAVDGGTITFTSAEARDRLDDLLVDDEDGWSSLEDEIFNSMMAHGYLATEWPIADGLNLARFSSGYGDGGYPVYIGFDAGDEPTQVVVDFALVHLAWPVDAG